MIVNVGNGREKMLYVSFIHGIHPTPAPYLSNSPSSALASWRSAVSNPSVNQP
jgi:hypothetical protein